MDKAVATNKVKRKQAWCYSDMPITLEVANDRGIIVL